MSSLVLLCCALLPTWAVAGGGSQWHTKESEYLFLEFVLLILMILLALVFELILHAWFHIYEHSYRYGDLGEQFSDRAVEDPLHSHRTTKHIRLKAQLVHRMGGEFMCLGCLAFSIFIANTGGLFEVLEDEIDSCWSRRLGGNDASADSECWHMPTRQSDWLHMFELVHMQLFLGMICYFGIVWAVVQSAVEKIWHWEDLWLRRMQHKSGQALQLALAQQVDKDLRDYCRMREYFLHQVLKWRKTRPFLFGAIVKKLNIKFTSEQTDPRLRTESVLLQVQQELQERFALGAYLALNLENSLMDTIEVNCYTWLAVVVVFAVCALAQRFLEVTHTVNTIVQFAFLGLVFIMLLVMRRLKLRWQQSVNCTLADDELHGVGDVDDDGSILGISKFFSNRTSQDLPSPEFGDSGSGTKELEDAPRSGQFFNTNSVTLMLRALQMLLFFFSYAFARTFVDLQRWKEYFQDTLLLSLIHCLSYIFLMYLIPMYVPVFVEAMSFPPFVSPGSFAAFFMMLIDDNTSHQSCKASNHQIHEKESIRYDTTKGAGPSEVADHTPFHASEHASSTLAVSELVNILAQCNSFEDLQNIRLKLHTRLTSIGFDPSYYVDEKPLEDTKLDAAI